MKKIDDVIKKAVSNDIDWRGTNFYVVIKALNTADFGVSFWDGEENWASILKSEKLVGYMWKKYPLIILERNCKLDTKSIIGEFESISIIRLDSLNKDLFYLDDYKLRDYFEGMLNFESFTMEDLWFNTNSN